jgi:hypothetical protein
VKFVPLDENQTQSCRWEDKVIIRRRKEQIQPKGTTGGTIVPYKVVEYLPKHVPGEIGAPVVKGPL